MLSFIHTHTFVYIMPLVQQTPKGKISLLNPLIFCLYGKEMLKK